MDDKIKELKKIIDESKRAASLISGAPTASTT